MPVDIPGFAYAAVVAAGGVFGYYKAGKQITWFKRNNKQIASSRL